MSQQDKSSVSRKTEVGLAGLLFRALPCDFRQLTVPTERRVSLFVRQTLPHRFGARRYLIENSSENYRQVQLIDGINPSCESFMTQLVLVASTKCLKLCEKKFLARQTATAMEFSHH